MAVHWHKQGAQRRSEGHYIARASTPPHGCTAPPSPCTLQLGGDVVPAPPVRLHVLHHLLGLQVPGRTGAPTSHIAAYGHAADTSHGHTQAGACGRAAGDAPGKPDFAVVPTDAGVLAAAPASVRHTSSGCTTLPHTAHPPGGQRHRVTHRVGIDAGKSAGTTGRRTDNTYQGSWEKDGWAQLFHTIPVSMARVTRARRAGSEENTDAAAAAGGERSGGGGRVGGWGSLGGGGRRAAVPSKARLAQSTVGR